MLPLYLAGASRELDRVLPIVAKLEASGLIAFTHRWWEPVQHFGVGLDHNLTTDVRRSLAVRAATGVADSKVFWLLYPNVPSTGAFFELGRAERGRADVVVTGARTRDSIFCALATFEHENDDAGLEHVLGLAQKHKERT